MKFGLFAIVGALLLVALPLRADDPPGEDDHGVWQAAYEACVHAQFAMDQLSNQHSQDTATYMDMHTRLLWLRQDIYETTEGTFGLPLGHWRPLYDDCEIYSPPNPTFGSSVRLTWRQVTGPFDQYQGGLYQNLTVAWEILNTGNGTVQECIDKADWVADEAESIYQLVLNIRGSFDSKPAGVSARENNWANGDPYAPIE